MTMDEFWMQDRIALSLELFGILVAILLVIVTVRAIVRRVDLVAPLSSPTGIKIFMFLRLLLLASGAVTLLITVFPDLMPFGSVDPNLELGGLLLFALWPLVAAQMGLACVRWEKRLTGDPIAIWIALLLAVVMCVPMDKTVIDFVFV